MRRWSIEDGLPQSTVTGIAPSPQGHLWLSTFGGIARFDGAHFTMFDPGGHPALGGNRFIGAAGRRDGSIWFRAEGKGLVRVEGDQVRAIAAPFPMFDTVGHGPLEDASGRLWASTGGGLYVVAGDEVTLVEGTEGIVGPEAHITIDDRGALWLVGDAGVVCWTGDCDAPGVRVDPDIKLLARLARGDRTTAIDTSGIARASESLRFKWASLIRWRGRLWEMRQDGLWSGTERIALSSAKVPALATPLAAVHVAADGDLWLGGFGQGLMHIRDRGVSFFGVEHGLGSSWVWGIVEDHSGRLWISDGDEFTWVVGGRPIPPPEWTRGLGHLRTLAAWKDAVWLVTEEAVYRLTDRAERVPLGVAPSDIDTMADLQDGGLWIGGSALSRYAEGRLEERLPAGSFAGRVQVIRDAPDGAVWIGTTEEVVRLDGARVSHFGPAEGLSGSVRDLWFDRDGHTWIGTYGAGLYAVDGARLRRFGASDGLCENVFSRMIADSQGALWINGNRGVSRLEISALRNALGGDTSDLRCDLFASGEGNGRAGLMATDGRLWLPTVTGIARVDPQSVRTPNPPEVTILSVRVDDVAVPHQGRAVAGRRDLVVEYGATDLQTNDKLNFRHRLVGHDNHWVRAGNERVARYLNLPPGGYGFELQARGPRGDWSSVAAHSVSLSPHAWETHWFKLLGASLALFAVAGAVWMRSIAVTRRAALAQAAETERQRQALAISEARLRLILESSADGIFGLDRSGRLTFVNSAANHMLRRDRSIVGRSLGSVVGGALPDGLPAEVHRALANGRSLYVDELSFAREDGTHFPVTVAVEPLWQDGAHVGAVFSFRDISGQRAAEQARLEGLRAAERLAQARSEFVANMSHEIRTPLTGVLGLAQLGIRHADDPRERRTFRRILDAGRHLLEVVDDVLDFSKLEAGKLHVEPGSAKIGAVVDRALEFVSSLATDRGLLLIVDEAPDLPVRMDGDEVRLAQVLVNLMSNSVKFTKTGHVALRVRRAEGTPEQLVFRVEDTGIGIAPEDLDRVFRAFEQADSSASRRSGGTGLGLAICRQLVQQMGGEIRVESTVGAGSCFEVRVPLQNAVEAPQISGRVALLPPEPSVEAALVAHGVTLTSAAEADLLVVTEAALRTPEARAQVDARLAAGRSVVVVERPTGDGPPLAIRDRVVVISAPLRARHLLDVLSAPSALPEKANPRLSGLRVLVAEDVEVNRLVLEDLLLSEGAVPTMTADGVAVVAAVEAGPDAFDVVLMDVQMPEMDGYAATRRIRGLVPRLPVLGVTAHATPEERARCHDSGMVAHLAKPYLPDALVSLILEHTAAVRAAPEIDRAALDARYPGRPEFVRRLLDVTVQSNRTVPAQLRSAILGMDFARVSTLAHAIKGTAGNLGGMPLATVADEVQVRARAGEERALVLAESLADRFETLLREAERR